MTLEQAKEAAFKRSETLHRRIYVGLIGEEHFAQDQGELESNGYSLQSPSPLIGYVDDGKWSEIKQCL